MWKTNGDSSGNGEWWRAGHDEHNTDAYGTDARPPGAMRDVHAQPLHDRLLRFTAPGDDWYAGKVDHYVLEVQTGRSDSVGVGPPQKIEPTVAGGKQETIQLPHAWRSFRIWAVDEAGNRDAAVKATVPRRFLHPFN